MIGKKKPATSVKSSGRSRQNEMVPKRLLTARNGHLSTTAMFSCPTSYQFTRILVLKITAEISCPRVAVVKRFDCIQAV